MRENEATSDFDGLQILVNTSNIEAYTALCFRSVLINEEKKNNTLFLKTSVNRSIKLYRIEKMNKQMSGEDVCSSQNAKKTSFTETIAFIANSKAFGKIIAY